MPALAHQGGGLFTTSLTVSSTTPTGNWQLEVTLVDGGIPAATNFATDTTAPTVTLEAEPARARSMGVTSEVDPATGFELAYKKGEFVELGVKASEPVSVTAADLTGVPSNAVAPRGSCTTCPGGYTCTCFDLDLAKVPLPGAGFRGVVIVSLSPRQDAYGNFSGAITPKTLKVTRWNWRRTIATGANAIQAPALDAQGHLFIGIAQGAQTGSVVGLEPNGQAFSSFSSSLAASVTSAPLISGSDLYLATKDATDGRIRKLSAMTGAQTASDCISSGYNFNSSMALTDRGQSPEAVIAVSNSGVLAALRVGAGLPCVATTVTTTTQSYNVVANAAAVFIADTNNVAVIRVPWAAAAWGTPTTNTGTTFTQGLALFGSTLAGGSAATTSGGVYALQSDGGLLLRAESNQPGTSSASSPPAIGGTATQPLFYFGNRTPALRRVEYFPGDPGSFDAGIVAASPPAQPIATAPLLGRSGIIYVVDVNGGVYAYNQALTSLQWSLPGAGATGPSTPTLDVARDAGVKVCGRPGVLYVPSTSDGTLTAYIVDSDGLDRTAPWPKYQHDPANTGNPDTSLDPWTCPP